MSLTPQQEIFAAAVASGLSKSDAYCKGYNTARMSRKTVNEAASRLARDSKVTARIAELRAPAVVAAEETTTVDLQRLLFEDARIAFVDIRKAFDENGQLKDIHALDADTAAAVASVEVVALFGQGKDGVGQIGYTKKLKFWPKGDAIDRLRRTLGGYEKDNGQKADALANIPREVLKLLEQRLLGLAKPIVGGRAAGRGKG